MKISKLFKDLIDVVDDVKLFLLLCLLVVCSFIVFGRPPSVTLVQPSQQSTYEIQREQTITEKLVEPVTLFTALLFFATFALWRSTKNLVTGTEITAKRQLRAYVGVGAITITDRDSGGASRLRLDIQNFGQTPAKDYRARVRWTNDINMVVDATQVEALHSSTLMPGAIDSIIVNNFIDVDSISRGNSNLLVGAIFYVDVFDNARFTEFRFLFDIRRETFSATEIGNDSD